jgi:uncharacterized membrane protein YdjX (TVP38/TMEM64 family)
MIQSQNNGIDGKIVESGGNWLKKREISTTFSCIEEKLASTFFQLSLIVRLIPFTPNLR